MEKVKELVDQLISKNTAAGCEALKLLASESKKSDEVYQFFDRLVNMMEEGNSYVRMRALYLIAINSRWDKDNKVDEIIDIYLKHITDEKPITSRKCIEDLAYIAENKKELIPCIREALMTADISKYKDSMRPLIQKDIALALENLDKLIV